MFTRPTVFVLGAGVSVPFGFPSGEVLLQIITGATPNEDYRKDHQTLKFILKESFNSKLLEDFVDSLKRSGTPSIDTWLAANKEFIPIGKQAIAILIANSEWIANDHQYVIDDWYKWLFRNMLKDTQDIAQFVNNQVSFITFNYDRMLEWKLGQYMQHFYRALPKNDVDNAIEAIFGCIHHVHGVLKFDKYADLLTSFGSIPMRAISSFQGQDRMERILTHVLKARELAPTIRIIGESAPSNDELIIDTLMEQANKMILLGFSYDERNLTLLKVKKKAQTIRIDVHKKPLEYEMVGSAFGLRSAQCEDIRTEFHHRIYLGDNTLRCVEFCNELVSLK